jgi:hypothetical protein
MGMGVGIFLVAVGAIMAFAIEVEESNGFDINAIGVILMIVGAFGILMSMIFWSSWGGWGGSRRDTVVYDNAPRRRTVIEQ